MDQKGLKEFKRGHWEDASYEVSTKLAKWLGRRSCLKEKVNAHMHDGQFAISGANKRAED